MTADLRLCRVGPLDVGKGELMPCLLAALQPDGIMELFLIEEILHVSDFFGLGGASVWCQVGRRLLIGRGGTAVYCGTYLAWVL